MAGLGGDGLRGWVGRLKSRRRASTGLLLKSVVYGQANQTKKTLWNDWFFAEVIFGSSATDTSIPDITSGTLAQISDILQVRTGASGDLNFYVDLSFLATPPGPTKVASISVQWQYRTVGGSWTDTFAEIPDSSDSVWDTEIPGQDFGYLTSSQNKTDLSANTNYEVRLLGRLDGGNASAGMSGPVVSVTAIASGVTVAITGQSAAAALQNVATQRSVSTTGISSVVTAGTFTTSKASSLTGQAVAVQNGNVTASTGATVSITGNSAALSLGAVTQNLDKGLTGQALASSTGTVTTTSGYTVNLTGVASSVALGSVTRATAKSLTGQAVSSALGAVTLSKTVSLSGLQTSVQQQSVTKGLQKALTGQTLTLSQSSVSATNAVTTSISGQSLSLSQSSATIAKVVSLTGQSTTLAQSSVSVENGVVVSISGQSLSIARGSLSSSRTSSIASVSATLHQGTVQTDSDVIVYLSGISTQLDTSSLSPALQASINGVENTLYTDLLLLSNSITLSGSSLAANLGTTYVVIPSVIEEYDVRFFDGLRVQGNLRNPRFSIRGLEHAMWGRVLAACEYVPYVYYAASSPSTLRIGYGRPITGTQEQEEGALNKNRESVWLNAKLTELYQRVLSANSTAELHEILTSTLYYYQVECQKSA